MQSGRVAHEVPNRRDAPFNRRVLGDEALEHSHQTGLM
jgi:hypothetical protein